MGTRDTPPRARGGREWRTVPLPPEWDRVIRPRILKRDPSCKIRTHCWGAASTEVDHIGDPSDHGDDNLRGTCERCHSDRTGRCTRDARASPAAALPSATASPFTERKHDYNP